VSGRKKVSDVRVVREDGAVVCESCTVAATPLRRLKGLLGRSGLEPGEGLLIRPTSSIHMFFMRFPIDALFLDRELVVRKVVTELRPWRIAFARGAKSVVELPAGEAAKRGVAPSDRLRIESGRLPQSRVAPRT
jgi:uncharacterized membrane protein (UPF0127 family)